MPNTVMSRTAILGAKNVDKHFQKSQNVYMLYHDYFHKSYSFAQYPLIDYHKPTGPNESVLDIYLTNRGFSGVPTIDNSHKLSGCTLEFDRIVEGEPRSHALLVVRETFNPRPIRIITSSFNEMERFVVWLSVYADGSGNTSGMTLLNNIIAKNIQKHSKECELQYLYEEIEWLKGLAGYIAKGEQDSMEKRLRAAERVLYAQWLRSKTDYKLSGRSRNHPEPADYAAMYLKANRDVIAQDVYAELVRMYGLQDGLEFGSSQWK